MPLTEGMSVNESLLKLVTGTWFPEMSRAGLGLDVVLQSRATIEDTPAPSSLMVAFKTPQMLDLPFSYLNINCKLFLL